MKDQPIIMDRTLDASPERIWKAITDREQMKQWYFGTIDDFKPEVGFQTQFNVRNGNKDYLHIWKVTEVIPFKKISYNWKFVEYPGDSVVSFELSSENNLTKLHFTHTGWDSFANDNPDFSLESWQNGWNYFLSYRLKKFLI